MSLAIVGWHVTILLWDQGVTRGYSGGRDFLGEAVGAGLITQLLKGGKGLLDIMLMVLRYNACHAVHHWLWELIIDDLHCNFYF